MSHKRSNCLNSQSVVAFMCCATFSDLKRTSVETNFVIDVRLYLLFYSRGFVVRFDAVNSLTAVIVLLLCKKKKLFVHISIDEGGGVEMWEM